jgi:hypothetical protein
MPSRWARSSSGAVPKEKGGRFNIICEIAGLGLGHPDSSHKRRHSTVTYASAVPTCSDNDPRR